jgi:hypothetical protein
LEVVSPPIVFPIQANFLGISNCFDDAKGYWKSGWWMMAKCFCLSHERIGFALNEKYYVELGCLKFGL